MGLECVAVAGDGSDIASELLDGVGGGGDHGQGEWHEHREQADGPGQSESEVGVGWCAFAEASDGIGGDGVGRGW